MTKLMQYNGLKTTRTTIHNVAPLLTASMKSNKLNVGNNGWEYEEHEIGTDNVSDGFSSSSFDVVFE